MSRGSTSKPNPIVITSAIEGLSLGEVEKTWRDLAASEMRLNMMDSLKKYKVGFNDVEFFNLGLKFNSKTLENDSKCDKKVVEAAMQFKRKDEVKYMKRLIREKLKMRKMMEAELGRKSNKYRRLIKHLNEIVGEKKKELNLKYEKKIEHLRKKFEMRKDEELDEVPEELKDFSGLAVFDNEKFENLKTKEIEVVKYGDIELDKDEIAAMKLHPKMAMPRQLQEGYMNLAQDLCYTKIRWQVRKEEEQEDRNEKKVEEVEEEEVIEARTRQVYDPQNREYDERRKRVTDMQECSRVFLPRPLKVTQEAQLEMRREMHSRVSKEYRKKFCDEKGKQENNLTKEEMRGIRKLEKRKQAGEIVIIMTDKSSKLCVMKRSDYLLLGEVHVGKDTVIERDELIRREKILNNHSLSWCKMWNTGENHHHEDRIRQSKVCNSENRAELYLSYKDHKKVPGKTRPIATGCTSNTLALSNSVSSLVESLANAEEKKLEVISTEDLLYSAKMSDKETEVMRIDNKVKMIRKLRCERCKPEMKESEEDEAGDRMPAQDERNGGLLCDQVNSLDMVAQEPADDHEIEEEKNTKMMKQILTKIIMNMTIKPTMSTPDDEGGGLLCD